MGRYTSRPSGRTGWCWLWEGKYYDSKQQEAVMDSHERHSAHRAAFPLYKSPPVLTYWKIGRNGPGYAAAGIIGPDWRIFSQHHPFFFPFQPAFYPERDNGVTGRKGNFCSMSFLLVMVFGWRFPCEGLGKMKQRLLVFHSGVRRHSVISYGT